jgi:glycerol-3-phosphate acyltransferase PlsY
MNALLWLLDVAIAFAVGSIPFGYLVGRLFFRTDIRAQGSGNIGAMNALRTLGKRGAAIVLVLDAIKGFVPVYFAARWSHNEPITAAIAIAAVLGHCFSPWLGWKGGKGVATSFGAIFGLSWKAGLVAVGGWVIGALATQYSSVGSMLGNLTAPFALWFFCESWAYTIYGAFAALFIIYTHRENLARLRAGTESRIRFSRARPDA